MTKKSLHSAKILGISLFSNSRESLLIELEDKLSSSSKLRLGGGSSPIVVFTPNPEMLLATQTDDELKSALLSSDYNIPDGIGVVWASRLLQTRGQAKVAERITGTDLMLDLIALAANKNWRVFLLGGQPGIANRAAANLKAVHQKLLIEAEAGPEDIKEADAKTQRALLTKINHFQPDLLFVGFGHGKQEPWLTQNRNQLRVGLAMGVGGALDFYAGALRRAPLIWQQLGLEWLYRLLQQPSRLTRIVNATIKFPLAILIEETRRLK